MSESTKAANAKQIGGAHYKGDEATADRANDLGLPVIEHWDFVVIRGYNYLQGNASKYLDRYEKKGTPIQDLEKAKHYIEKLLEVERAKLERQALRAAVKPKGRRA